MASTHSAAAPVFGNLSSGPLGLQTEGQWYYNRWLGRWRNESAQRGEGSGPQLVEAPEAVDAVPFDDSDRALVERVKTGDVRAFETLHKRYYGRIYRLAFLRLGNADDASDVASTTFCKALHSLPGYQFRRTPSLYPWLHQITSNLIVDVMRSRPAGGMLSLDAQVAEDVDSFLEYLPADGPSPQEIVERGEVQQAVRQAINKLPDDQARAITLRFLSDLSIREIARELDRSEGAVKSLLHRALQSMRQHLKSLTGGARVGAQSVLRADVHTQKKAEDHVSEVVHVRPRNP